MAHKDSKAASHEATGGFAFVPQTALRLCVMVTTFGSFPATLVMHALSSTESPCAQQAWFNTSRRPLMIDALMVSSKFSGFDPTTLSYQRLGLTHFSTTTPESGARLCLFRG